jgi:D-alanyl-D-alanine carboxypeptidase (penicillin-binding protein 5/6)
MNRHGEEIGLTGSHFMNASGLPDTEHYMTARDIAKLAALLISEFPEYYKWYSQKQFTFNGITQYNRNKLLWRDDAVDGVKTGHTESAGYCLVTSAEKDNMRLITVVLGTKSEGARADASQALLNYGFRFFETHKLYDADTQLATSRVWKGEIETVSLGLDSPLYATIPRGQYKSLEASMTIDNRITAPVAREQSLGIVQVQLGETVIAEQELIALQNISEGSFWQRIVDEALLYFE